SGGQKQRVAIASVLAMHPRVLVLDEPTSGLDPVGKADVFRVVRELKLRHDVTIVMVEQNAEQIAEFSDRVIVLNEGVVALDGVPRDVFARADLMTEIGLAVPQVSELAALHNQAFGTEFSFLDVDEAAAGLSGELGHGL
ncbi:MAG: ATP-binding cassette domain-containing protein, partial [Anaerolineae bacterium]|nr:ATP-binding cassette domain-containing protein [Anaerolineae bacterium]